MNWLNLETKILHSPDFIGSKPVARATWLSVALWAAEQENGGKIIGAKKWGNRQWQQTCGVTLKEIEGASPLLSWDGDDILIWNYPTGKEAEVRSKREAGREGGLRSGEARARSTASSRHEAQLQAPLERKGSGKEGEGNGKEGEGEASPPISFSNTVMPDLATWLSRVSPSDEWETEWWTKVWNREAKAAWRMRGGRQIVDWCLHQDSFVGYFVSAKKEREAKNAPVDESQFLAERQREEERRTAVEQALAGELLAGLKEGRQ